MPDGKASKSGRGGAGRGQGRKKQERPVDGNVARVLARWYARPWQVKRPADAKTLWALAGSLVPARGGRASSRSRWLLRSAPAFR